ncbi:hypothetical protein [Mariniblastus fucicola]|uniref:Outer membrane protein beta-barrel domain-containing protein n=1 Tax=Mariniblastus fucicola TaxID=980251 RepID=A0A5B9P8B9_9BACT|nr:hypothetical protein [Mariniblastus fucicola]QEG22594.1 hypothetical protein MFFC18_24770 [Mariniblastus fucicola]
MQKLLKHTTLAAITLVMCIVSDANAQWPEYTQIGEKNYIEIGGRAYNRPGTDLQLSILQDATTAETLFSANDATSASSAAGVEVSYNFATKYGRAMEFRMFTGTWDAKSNIDQGNIESPLFPGEIADFVEYNYDARIFSFELNAKRPLAQGTTLFGGPRYVSFNDKISYVAGADADLIGTANPFDTERRQSIEAINNLIGLQAGLRHDKQLTQYFRAAGFIRAGGYFNPTKVRTSNQAGVVGVPPTELFRTESTKSTGSLLAEVGGKVYLDFAPSCSLFAGYEATWIDGVALAPPSFLSAETGEVETANTLFMHAITFGMRFGW